MSTAAVALAAVLTACSEAAAPRLSSSEKLIIDFVSSESTSLVLVDVGGRRVIARSNELPHYRGSVAIARDTSALYFTAFADDATPLLLAVNTRSLTVTQRATLSEMAARGSIDNLELKARGLTFTPDGQRLVFADASRLDTAGLALVDVASTRPVAFVGPFSASLLATVPQSASYPQGAVLAAATRTPGALPTTGILFLLDGASLDVVDSIPLVQASGDIPGYVDQLLVSPNGERVYVTGPAYVYAYDLVERVLVGSVQRPSRGTLAIAPDGASLYMTDPGDGRDVPGSGLVFVFGPELQPKATIDLRPYASVEEDPPRTVDAVVSSDGAHVYITSGSNLVGPLYPGQPGRVLVLDVANDSISATIPLHDSGPGKIFVGGP
ncbi:MAG TPA: hypothetical protein VFK39_09955 [Gemmatimonadaceae bacterium]|nr:hypothetical protein [Gemmatimonadaceae bacterium]